MRRSEESDPVLLRSLLKRTKEEGEAVSFRPGELLAPLGAVSSRIESENTTREWLEIRRAGEGARLRLQSLNGEAEGEAGVALPDFTTTMPGMLIAAVKALAEVVEGEEEIEARGWSESCGLMLSYKDRARVLMTGLRGGARGG